MSEFNPRISRSKSFNAASNLVSNTRNRQLGRDKLLEEFTTRFVKTRSELHTRNEQCTVIANEIPKYKKELIELHEQLQLLERLETERREQSRVLQDQIKKEQGNRKTYIAELAKVKKEKQDRLAEKEKFEKEYDKVQYQFRKVYEEHVQLETAAKRLSKQLQEINQERLKYRKAYYDSQELSHAYAEKLESLKDELQDMRSFVYTTLQ